MVPGLRAGHYLCFFGMHVLTPTVMDFLAALDDGDVFRRRWPSWRAASNTWRWSRANRRYDIGVRYGLLNAQLALALGGRDRDEVLAQIGRTAGRPEMARGRESRR